MEIKDFNEAIRLDPDNAYAYVHRSMYYEEFGDRKQAKEDRKKAEEIMRRNE
jgi:Tfp pilus assembly protein PilF